MASFGLLPAIILVKSVNSFGGTFHGTEDRDGSCEEFLLYLQSLRFNRARRQNDYYGFILPLCKL